MNNSSDTFLSEADKEILAIATYTCQKKVGNKQAYMHARYCLMDALGCAFEALEAPECTKLLGPTVPGTYVPSGTRVPGTALILDPIKQTGGDQASIKRINTERYLLPSRFCG